MGRFASLVDTPETREAFEAKYNISTKVTIQYCELKEWYTKRQTGDVVIPMIAFIKGGMRIPMDGIMRDLLSFFRLCPIQCSLNLF